MRQRFVGVLTLILHLSKLDTLFLGLVFSLLILVTFKYLDWICLLDYRVVIFNFTVVSISPKSLIAVWIE